MADGKLKPGWRRVKFGDVVRLNTERVADPAAAGLERYVGLEHIEPEDLRIRRWGRVADGTTFTNRFRPGQVLFGKRRAYQRKVAVADFDGVCSGDIYIFESKDPAVLLPELVPFLCQTEGFFEYAVGTSAGSLSPRTNWTQLAQYEFALPPLEEQRRIVSRIGALDVAKEAQTGCHSRLQQLLVPLARSLMGIEDGLEETDIMQGQILVTRAGWPIMTVKSICTESRQDVQVGPFGGSVSSRYFAPKGVPILKINNITESGGLDLSNLVYLQPDHAKRLSGRYAVEAGDIITASQATIGRTAIVTPELTGAIISQHLIRVAVDPAKCLPEWLHACFHTPLLLRQIHSGVQGGTRAGLNTQDVRNLKLPVPPISFQEAFCQRLFDIRDAASRVALRWAETNTFRWEFLEDCLN